MVLLHRIPRVDWRSCGAVTNKDQRVVLIHLGKARMGNDGGVSYG